MAVGVLALQGSFREHIVALKRIGVDAIEIRKPEQLQGLAGLIIPGGESTTMAKLAVEYQLIPALKDFSQSGRPIWGTCAGLIFLADKAVGQKLGGQALLGGLDVTVHRNFFGSQLNSFEAELQAPPTLVEGGDGDATFRAVFIRAPAILDAGPSVEILAEINVSTPSAEKRTKAEQQATEVGQRVIVAVRQGNILATAFHPELTSDTRWHSLFVKMTQSCEVITNHQKCSAENGNSLPRPLAPTKDLPVFRDASFLLFE